MSKSNSKKYKGKQSIEFTNPPYILQEACVVGKKEGEGPLGKWFDVIEQDPMFGGDTWEEGESNMVKQAISLVIKKAKLTKEDIRYIVGGDLLGQLIASSFGVEQLSIPLFGVYGACSTMGESIALASVLIEGGYADKTLAFTSSHFAGAEKQFRFPLGYGNQRPYSATWTVTGSGAVILSKEKPGDCGCGGEGSKDSADCGCSGESGSHGSCGCSDGQVGKELSTLQADVVVTGITPGKIVDYGIKDSMNMGAAMAPAAVDTIYQNLTDFNRSPEYYDRIVTGDLGTVGKDILIELLKEKGFDISRQHMDCGIEIYDQKTQDTHAGGSGCGCSAITLNSMILRRFREGELKRVLFMATGALLSTPSSQQGETIPGVAHAVVLEADA